MFKYLGNWSRIKISNNKFKIGVSEKERKIVSVVTAEEKSYYFIFSIVLCICSMYLNKHFR